MLPFVLAITLDQRILLLLFISAHFTKETSGGRGWFLTKQPYLCHQSCLLQEVGFAGRGRTGSWSPWPCSDHYSSHLKKPHTFPKTGRKKIKHPDQLLERQGPLPMNSPRQGMLNFRCRLSTPGLGRVTEASRASLLGQGEHSLTSEGRPDLHKTCLLL